MDSYLTDRASSSCPADSELDMSVDEEAADSLINSLSQSLAQQDSQRAFLSDTGVRAEGHCTKQDIPEDNSTIETTLTLHSQAHRQWKDIARQWHLGSDTQVACFLVQHFQETRNDRPHRCSACDSPLTMYCSKCNKVFDTPTSRQTSHSSNRSFEGEIDAVRKASSGQPAPKPSNTNMLKAGADTASKTSSVQHGPDVTDTDSGKSSALHRSELSSSGLCSTEGVLFNADSAKEMTSSELKFKTEAGLFHNRSDDSGVSFSRTTEKEVECKSQSTTADQTVYDGLDSEYHLSTTGEAEDTQPRQNSVTSQKKSSHRRKRTSICKMQVVPLTGDASDEKDVENSVTLDLACERCGISFKTVHAFRQHVRRQNCKTSKLLTQLDTKKTETASRFLSEKPLPQTLHSCNVCGKSFSERKALRAHMLQHIGDRPFSCTLCYATFKSAGVLKEHMSSHSADKPFPCEKCSKKYRTKKDLLTHQRHCHRNEKPFTCTVCGRAYKTQGSLNFHMKSHNRTKPVEKKFICSTCGDAFARKSTLQNHVLRHTGEKPHVCNTCGAAFNALSTLIVHKRSHSGERPYVCSQCDASFIQSSDLGKHMKRKHSNEKPFECTICHLKYATRSDLNKHLVNCMHKRPKGRQRQSCVCDLCGAFFKDANYLRVHKMRHLGQKPFVCDECGWAFVVNSELQAHMKVHSGHKPFVCDQCGSSFFNAGSLRKHQRKHMTENTNDSTSETTGYVSQSDAAGGIRLKDITCAKSEQTHNENKFLCAECGQSFKTQASFSDHLKQHSLNEDSLLTQGNFAEMSKQQTPKKPIERNFVCTTCGAAFGKKSVLQNHILRHTGAKPHVCSICNAAFRALSTLIVHRRSHSGEKPYVCSQCGAAFIQSSDLNKHIKRNHGDYRPHECKLCGSRYATKRDLNRHFTMHALTDNVQSDGNVGL